MSVREYLPSQQFSVIVVSIAFAAGLIAGAKYYVTPHGAPAQVAAAADPTGDDWQAQLDAIQATAPGLPEAPSPDTVNAFLQAAQSENLTDSVARSLFINLSDAKSQGLGDDIPTQDQLVAQAASLAAQQPAKNAYTLDDITLGGSSQESLHAYGNAVAEALISHPKANVQDAYAYLSAALDAADESQLSRLKGVGEAYAALAEDLASVPVPPTLAPLHLKAVNDFAAAAGTFGDIANLVKDPIKSLAALQSFQSLQTEAGRVLTTIGEQLRKNGILFTKDEPGSAWSVFLAS